MAEERTFFGQGDIQVTNARFVVGAQTFAMRNVTSVAMRRRAPNTTAGGLLAGSGGLMALIGFNSSSFIAGSIGIAMFAGGIWWIVAMKDEHEVVLTTSAGEVSAYKSMDKDLIARIVKALNDSLAAGG
jgi:hypothetical protein